MMITPPLDVQPGNSSVGGDGLATATASAGDRPNETSVGGDAPGTGSIAALDMQGARPAATSAGGDLAGASAQVPATLGTSVGGH